MPTWQPCIIAPPKFPEKEFSFDLLNFLPSNHTPDCTVCYSNSKTCATLERYVFCLGRCLRRFVQFSLAYRFFSKITLDPRKISHMHKWRKLTSVPTSNSQCLPLSLVAIIICSNDKVVEAWQKTGLKCSLDIWMWSSCQDLSGYALIDSLQSCELFA